VTAHLHVARLVKSYDGTNVVDGLDLHIEPGVCFGLLGPNGAGKTTTLAIAVGLRRADSGSATVFGADPRVPTTRRRIGVTPQDASFPPTLRVHDVVRFVFAHYPRHGTEHEVLNAFGLTELRDRQCGALSGGERRRLALALAFAHVPSLVVLDEPTTGLDVEARAGAWQTISSHGGAVLLTTHNLVEAERLADRIIVIDRGRLLAAGAPDELRQRVAARTIRLAAATLPALPTGTTVTAENGRVTIVTRDVDAVIKLLAAAGTPLNSLEVGAASLEDAFLELTRRNREP